MDNRKVVRTLDRQIICVAIISILCSGTCVLGEEIDDFFAMSPEQLANISVSIATGTAKPAYQSAAVTTVITAEQIKTMGATELSQVLETVPGLHVRIQGITNDPVYSMRGISNDVNAQVLIMLNGTRFSEPYKGSNIAGMELPVEAIERIEVIRGPGSALYGADAFAGVINVITKKAKDIAGTEVGIRGGAWDTQSVWGLHGNEWLGWDIAATLQYAHNNNDGDRIISSDAQSQFDAVLGTNASLAPHEMQTQAERWNAHLNMQRKHWDIGFWAFNTVNGGLRAGSGGALDDEGMFDNENYLADLRFSSEDLIEDWEFLAHTSYLYTNLDADIHNFPDGTRLPIDTNGNISPAGNLVFFPDGIRTRIGVENQVVTFEISSFFKGFENHLLKLTSGYRYEQVQTKEQRNFGFGIIDGLINTLDGGLTDVTGTDLVFLPNSHRSIWSVALQDEWQINADWSFTAGVRYDEYSDFGSTFNPRLALVWNVSEQLNAKLLYGHAYRAPSFLEQKQQNSQLFVGNSDLEPETIETIELAFDYRPVSNLRLASNFYFYEIDDLIGTEASEINVATVKNTVGQTAYGAEFEWNWKFHNQWSLKGNYAWQYARNSETHRRVRDVPEHQVYVAVTWRFLTKWQLQTQLNWIGHRLIPVASDNKQLNDYETIDVTLNSRRFFGCVDFSASLRNAFDTHGKESGTTNFKDNFPIASRSFYLETTLHF